eukprot:s820_g7.t1
MDEPFLGDTSRNGRLQRCGSQRSEGRDVLFRRLGPLVSKGLELEDLWRLEVDVVGADALLQEKKARPPETETESTEKSDCWAPRLPKLVRVLFGAYWPQMLPASLFKLAADLLRYVPAYLLSEFLDLMESHEAVDCYFLMKGMIDYNEDWLFSTIFRLDGSVALRSTLFAFPAAMFSLLLMYLDEFVEDFRDDLGIAMLASSQIWNASTVVLVFLLGFRARQGLARFWEGTGLLHQMRGEWFDTVSNCVTFSISARPGKPEEVMAFRHTLVRLMSLCHGSALEEISGDVAELRVIDVMGLDAPTLHHLWECSEVHQFNRVEVCLHLLQTLITKALDDGVLKIPPPILSRVYQTISRGFVNLLKQELEPA